MAHLLDNGVDQLCDVLPPLMTMDSLAMDHLPEDGGGRPGNGPAPLIVTGGLAMALLLRVLAAGLPITHL